MIMIHEFLKQPQHANNFAAMETGDHSKNRISMQKLLILLFTIVLCLLSCKKDEVNVKTDLSDEEIAVFYTRIESFVETPDFKSRNSIEELKPLVENWLKQQPEVASVKIDGNILTFTLLNGSVTEIEFEETEEITPEDPFDFEWETIDGSYFTDIDSDSHSMNSQKQAITKSQSTTRATTPYYPDYIYPVFWEPTLNLLDLKECFEKSVCRKEGTLSAREILCDPSHLPTYLNPSGATLKPNLIFIAVHGSSKYLQIGCRKNDEDVQKSLTQLEKYGIDIRKETRKIRITTTPEPNVRHMISLHVDDLAKLLQNVDISNAIVFLIACNSFSTTDSANISAFADVFTKRGAAYVYGFSGIISNWNNIVKYLLNCLIAPNNIDSNPNVLTKTTAQALDYVKKYTNMSQMNLLQGIGKYPNFRFQHPVQNAVPRSSAHALTTKSLQEPVDMYGCHINYYSPGTVYSQSFCGLVYSSETNNPKIGDGKSNYKFKELDHEVFDGEDFYFSFDDIEYNTQYHYRAFVCSIYSDGQAYIYYSEEVEPFEVEKEEDEEEEEEPPVPPVNTPPNAASTQTWVFGNQIWSDRIVASPSNCINTDMLSTDMYPPAEYKVYDGRYYYNWTCAYNNRTEMCPSPWRLPSVTDFNTLASATDATTLIDAWGFGGAAEGSDMRNVDFTASYWSATEYTIYCPYYLGYLSGHVYPEAAANKYYGMQVRCVCDK
jgi:hypothetical protein